MHAQAYRCTALRTFSFHPHPHFPLADQAHSGESQDGFNPSWLMQPDPNDDSVGGSLRERLSSSLRILDIAATLDERLLVRMQWFLSAATNLTILKLGPVEPAEYSSELLDHPPLDLHALEELQIHADQESFQHYICTRWVLPALTRLTATDCAAFPEVLLRAHGAQLTHFHMRHGHRQTHAWELALARLPALAPRVEHLVIPTWTWICDPLLVHSPTLRFLDVWAHHPPAHIVKPGRYELADACALPRLERVRILSTMPLSGWESMQMQMQSLDSNWPRICHPLSGRAEEQEQLALPGVRVVQTAWDVLHDYLDEDLSWWPERRDNSGAYEPEPGDDAESSFGSEGSEAEVAYALREELEELRGRGWDGPVEQYGRDDVLRMYHESQGRAFLFDQDEE